MTTSPWLSEEPMVPVAAGLIGTAVELLDLCDQLLNHPGHDVIDAREVCLSKCTRAGV